MYEIVLYELLDVFECAADDRMSIWEDFHEARDAMRERCERVATMIHDIVYLKTAWPEMFSTKLSLYDVYSPIWVEFADEELSTAAARIIAERLGIEDDGLV